jgi:putative acetyltransferase
MCVPTIRPESVADHEAIRAVTEAAFDGMWFAAGDEHELPMRLRTQGALVLSLVGELDGVLIGHIAVSPAYPESGGLGWFAIGPVSVMPAHQRSGVGSALVRAALAYLGSAGASGCILTGDPNYYGRFGFEVRSSHAPEGEPPDHYMVKLIEGPLPDGKICFHPAFHESA